MPPSSKKTAKGAGKELATKNRFGVDPPKRINVANEAVADELLASQNLLFLQQDDYYKAQEHINLLSGEIDSLKAVVSKKQDLINRLQKGVSDRDYKIEELKKEVAQTHIERSAFKVLEEQNSALMLKVTETGTRLEDVRRNLKNKVEEQDEMRKFSDEKIKNSIKTEVLLQATIQEIGHSLQEAVLSKDQSEEEQIKVRDQMIDLQKHLKLVSETSQEQLYRSRQTEYKTLRRLDEVTTKFVQERDDKDLLRDTVKMSGVRADILENRLADTLEKQEGQQLMVQSIVRQVESSNDSMRAREKLLEKQNMNLIAQLKVSQMAVADMIKKYRVLEDALDQSKMEIFEIKQKGKPKRRGEQEDTKKDPPGGMGGSTSSNVTKLYMDKMMSLTTASVAQTFPGDDMLQNSVTSSILSSNISSEIFEGRNLGNTSQINDIDNYDGSKRVAGGKTVYGGDSSVLLTDVNFDRNSASSIKTNKSAAAAAAVNSQTPQLLNDVIAAEKGKTNLISAYLRLMIGVQNVNNAQKLVPQQQNNNLNNTNVVDFSRCELGDTDMKQILDLLRLLQLRDVTRIDFRYNKFTSKTVDILSAFVSSIASVDYANRNKSGNTGVHSNNALEIDLRFNFLTKKGIEKLGLKIKQTPRPEVKFVAVDEDGQVIVLYGTNKPLLRIDCRNNCGSAPNVSGTTKKLSLKERLALGPNVSQGLPISFPGDDIQARNPDLFQGTIYPRNELLNR